MSKYLTLAAAAIAALIILPSPATAEPAFARMYKSEFGYPPSCNACHKDGGGTPLNGYGEQFKEAGMKSTAFATIAKLDGDGDGFANGAEAIAKSNPGYAKSTPEAKGDWLDISSLIPKEVQALFPDVRAYLPKDALLTAEDIARAKALGADLVKADENTIYIPVVERRPAGTAIIFPATFEGKTFYLLMSTDRTLNVTKVKPLDTRHVKAAADEKLYTQFSGVALQSLPKAQGEDLQSAVVRAVKKAGTLVFVRLKSA